MRHHHRRLDNPARKQVEAWKHPPGTMVLLRTEGGAEMVMWTRGSPEVVGGVAVIWLEAPIGCYPLERVRRVE